MRIIIIESSIVSIRDILPSLSKMLNLKNQYVPPKDIEDVNLYAWILKKNPL